MSGDHSETTERLGGYAGRILRVDLTTGSAITHPTEPDLARAYLGGRGLNVKRLWDEVPAHTDGLAPENKLVFGAGPLAGSLFPGSRFNVSAMSPQTGILGDSNAGGFFGPELKYAGYDQLIIEGRAERPVYLWVRDDQVELRDASHLWGLDVTETTEAIRSELGDRDVQVAAIGPAAENGVRFSGIFVNLVRAAARTGMGAVLASKNVKAVAVRGTKMLPVADIGRFEEIMREVDRRVYEHPEYQIRYRLGTTKLVMSLQGIGAIPTRHFQSGRFEHAVEVSGETIEARFKVKNKGCFGCTIPCSRFLVVEDPRFPGLRMEGPEYEPLVAFTARVGNGDLALGLHCVDLANRYGMDAIALSEVISWSMECFERGILTTADTDGLELVWGDGPVILALIDKVMRREGFGDVLADGVRAAASSVGRGSEELAMHGKGLEVFQSDPRAIKAYALGNAVASRGADHLRSEPWFEFSQDAEEGIRRYGVPESAFRLGVEGQGAGGQALRGDGGRLRLPQHLQEHLQQHGSARLGRHRRPAQRRCGLGPGRRRGAIGLRTHRQPGAPLHRPGGHHPGGRFPAPTLLEGTARTARQSLGGLGGGTRPDARRLLRRPRLGRGHRAAYSPEAGGTRSGGGLVTAGRLIADFPAPTVAARPAAEPSPRTAAARPPAFPAAFPAAAREAQ